MKWYKDGPDANCTCPDCRAKDKEQNRAKKEILADKGGKCEVCGKEVKSPAFCLGATPADVNIVYCKSCWEGSYFMCCESKVWTHRSKIFIDPKTDKTVNKTFTTMHTCPMCTGRSSRFRAYQQEHIYGNLEGTPQRFALCHKHFVQYEKEHGELSACDSCGDKYVMADSEKYADVLEEFGASQFSCPRCALGDRLPLVYDGAYEVEGSGRMIGLEVECEPTVESQLELYRWMDGRRHLVCGDRDSSLRGAFPCEYKSPILHESNYEDWIDEFCSMLTARVYNRCGFHIHLGTEDFSWLDINNLMRYCYNHQATFSSMVSSSRTLAEVPNSAGLPVMLPGGFRNKRYKKSKLVEFLYGKAVLGTAMLDNRRANDRSGPRFEGAIHRYQWLNIHGHFHKRAIEIRLHHGTTEAAKMKRWIQLWLHIINHVHKHGEKGLKVNPLDAVPKGLANYYRSRSEEFSGWSAPLIEGLNA